MCYVRPINKNSSINKMIALTKASMFPKIPRREAYGKHARNGDFIFHVPKGYEMIIKGFCLGGGLGRKASG
jgi:hypothetical protein